MMYADLHCHSTASDGALPPAEVVRLAVRQDLSALALTDHDTIAGVREAADEARRQGLAFLSGIEISATYESPGTLHLLGYGVDPDSPVLLELSRRLIEARDSRNPRIVARLHELGIDVSMAEWEAEAGGEVVGRPHLAAILVRKGVVGGAKEAFDKYLGHGGLAYVDKERLPPRQAIEMIRQSGGVAVLAHPVQLQLPDAAAVEKLVRELMEWGLAGVEVLHSDHSPEQSAAYEALADRLGLLKTGGSDFHGARKKDIELGFVRGARVPREWFDELSSRLRVFAPSR